MLSKLSDPSCSSTCPAFALETVASDKPFKLNPNQIAEMAYQAEVEEFNESGGMMDQYSTAVGQIIYLKPSPSIKLERLDVSLGTFVLGDLSLIHI